MIKVIDLFSGIGGFSLGLERAGPFQTIQFVEQDDKARQVLRKHWPDVPQHDDIRTYQPTLGAADLVCGGFPCQDISSAGRGVGIVGERSGLWSEMARVIGAVRPRWVIAENVSALRSKGLTLVLQDLCSLGYDAEWHCIPASAVGAPHRRDRVWIIAYRNSDGDCQPVVPVDAEASGVQGDVAYRNDQPETEREYGEDVQSSGTGGQNDRRGSDGTPMEVSPGVARQDPADVAHPNSPRLEVGQREPRDDGAEQSAVVGGGEAGNVPNSTSPGQLRAEQLEDNREGQRGRGADDLDPQGEVRGWEGQWAVEPPVGRVAHGVPFELHLLRGLNEEVYTTEAIPAGSELEGQVLRAVWESRALAETSPELYLNRLHDLVPGVPQELALGGWFLGAWLESSKGLRDLWEAFYTKPLQETQDLQQELSKRVRAIERTKEVGPMKGRVDRLKQLGNSIVPQIATLLGQAIIRRQRH